MDGSSYNFGRTDDYEHPLKPSGCKNCKSLKVELQVKINIHDDCGRMMQKLFQKYQHLECHIAVLKGLLEQEMKLKDFPLLNNLLLSIHVSYCSQPLL